MGLFKGYLNREETTRESFDEDGWFKTGDIAVKEVTTDSRGNQMGYYRLLGRNSVDIIKVS